MSYGRETHGERELGIVVLHAPHVSHGPFVRLEPEAVTLVLLPSPGVARSRTRNDARRVCDGTRRHRAVYALYVHDGSPARDAREHDRRISIPAGRVLPFLGFDDRRDGDRLLRDASSLTRDE